MKIKILSDATLEHIVGGVVLQNPVYPDEGANDPRTDNQDPGAGSSVAAVATYSESFDLGFGEITGPQALVTTIRFVHDVLGQNALGPFTSQDNIDEAPGLNGERPSVLDGSHPNTPGSTGGGTEIH